MCVAVTVRQAPSGTGSANPSLGVACGGPAVKTPWGGEVVRPGGAEIWFCVAAAGAGAVGPGSPCSPVRRFHTEAVQFPDGDGALTTPWGVVEAGPGSSAQERLASLLTGAGTGVGSSLCPALLPRCPGASLLPQATSPSGLLTAPWKAAAGPHLRFPALSGREADLSSPPHLCPDSVGCAQAATGGSSSEIQAPERATPFYTCQRPCPGQRTPSCRERALCTSLRATEAFHSLVRKVALDGAQGQGCLGHCVAGSTLP